MFLRLIHPDATEDDVQRDIDAYTDKDGVGLVEVTCPNLRAVPRLEGFSALKDLLLVRCPLLVAVSVDQPVLSQLTTLVLDHCSLSALPEGLAEGMPLLEVLSAECNQLVRLPARLPERLVVLLLAKNALRRVPRLDGLQGLLRLSLRDNALPAQLAAGGLAASDRGGCARIVQRVRIFNREWRARDAAMCLLLIRWCRRNEYGLLGLMPKELVRSIAQDIVRGAVHDSVWDR